MWHREEEVAVCVRGGATLGSLAGPSWQRSQGTKGLRKSRGDRMCLGICETGRVCLLNPSECVQSEASFLSHREASPQEIGSGAPSLGLPRTQSSQRGLRGPSQDIKTYLGC